MKPAWGTATRLAAASAVLGVALGLMGGYSTILTSSPTFISERYIPLNSFLAVSWVSLAVTYPVTVYVFYRIGKRPSAGFRTGRSLFAIYFASLLGQVLGKAFLIPFGGARLFPYSSLSSFPTSLNFLFIAFSGFALSNLSRPDGDIAGRPRGTLLVPLVALAFGLEGGFFLGVFSLGLSSLSFTLLGEIGILSLALAFPVSFIVFYHVGRRASVSGHTFRFFGLLFVGLYVGEVVGALVSVALFGQGSWAPSSPESVSWANGVIYTGVAPSLKVVLESLNPVGSLPFLPFFAMSVSRTSTPRRGGGTDQRESKLPS